MFIQTEDTPNPEALKFLPSREVLGDAQKGMADFTNAEAAAVSPLASSLFEIDGVKGVMLGRDFLTVTKRAQSDWAALKPQILAAIMDHFVVGNPVFVAGANVAELQTGGDEDDVVAQIRDIIDQRVRPGVARDGGDIVFHSFKDGVVYLSLKGSCAGCPSAHITLKQGVENLLKHYVPEVKNVKATPLK